MELDVELIGKEGQGANSEVEERDFLSTIFSHISEMNKKQKEDNEED